MKRKRRVIIHRECETTQIYLDALEIREEEVDHRIEQLRLITLSASKKARKKARLEIRALRRELKEEAKWTWDYLISLGLVEFVD